MDLLSEINRRILQLGPHDRVNGIRAAVRHIEVAERYLYRGRKEQDTDSFNDVLYRTNQAFEGMLKEAYAILEDKNKSQLSPFEIEKQFLDKRRLTERSLVLFRNYRQEWRNPATHDHTLVFSEQEALLAIVSVSAFALVLLDQVVEAVSFKRHRVGAERLREALSLEDVSHGHESLSGLAARCLILFSRQFGEGDISSEAELLGGISGFLVGLSPDVKVTSEVRLGNRTADLQLQRNEEIVIIEVEHGRGSQGILQAALVQMQDFLEVSGARAGILYFWPPAEPALILRNEASTGGRDIMIIGLDPSAAPSSFIEIRRPTRILKRTPGGTA